MVRLVETELPEVEDYAGEGVENVLKHRRLIGDMAQGANRLFMRAAEGEYRAKRDDALAALLQMLAEDRKKGLIAPRREPATIEGEVEEIKSGD